MEVPTHIYFGTSTVAPSRIYHVRNCNGHLSETTKVPATEETLELLHKLGYTVCKTCKLRYEKEEKAKEYATFIEAYNIVGLTMPPEFELRVYWHRPGKGQPTEIWNSKTGLKK